MAFKIDREGFILFSVVFVFLMYLVPYGVLNGVEGPLTFIFWIAISVAYLIFVGFCMQNGRHATKAGGQ